MSKINENRFDSGTVGAQKSRKGCDMSKRYEIVKLPARKMKRRSGFLKSARTFLLTLYLCIILVGCGGGGGEGGGNASGSGSGSVGGASLPSGIFNVQITANMTTVEITWQTDEPGTSVVDYGPTTAYELGPMEDLPLKTGHSIELTGLDPNTTYQYRITSEYNSGDYTNTANSSFTTQTNPGGPLIDIWYGNIQRFGHIGIPQTWANILGQ